MNLLLRSFCTILTAAAILTTGTALAGEEKEKKQNDVLEAGIAAPNFTLKTLNADRAGLKRFALREFVGPRRTQKPRAVVLSFAASYCVPCVKELEELSHLTKTFEKNQVKLAVVVIDTEPEGIEKMKALTSDKLALKYPVLSDRFGVLARRYKANNLPMTVIINPAGKVEWVNVGFEKDAIAKLLAKLGIKK